MPISSGIMAPDFELPDENETIRRLSDFRGRTVVLYFYPKDDTPGCTTEACGFRDDYSAYVKADVVILGVSPDSAKSHGKFKNKFTLPFPLLADEGHKICSQYGVWGIDGRNFSSATFVTDDEFVAGSVGALAELAQGQAVTHGNRPRAHKRLETFLDEVTLYVRSVYGVGAVQHDHCLVELCTHLHEAQRGCREGIHPGAHILEVYEHGIHRFEHFTRGLSRLGIETEDRHA